VLQRDRARSKIRCDCGGHGAGGGDATAFEVGVEICGGEEDLPANAVVLDLPSADELIKEAGTDPQPLRRRLHGEH
jgi:hypothetical protein